jgi:2-oxoglutarate ferredoxin oxidoreductase subunit gamma
MTKKLIFAGFGGQGVLMMGYLLAFSAMRDGKNVTYLPAYGAEVRGGTANCTVVIADEEIYSPVASSPDYVIVMNKPSLKRYEGMVASKGTMFINSSLVDIEPNRSDINVVKIPVNDIAKEIGSDKAINMIMLGAVATKTGLTTLESLESALREVTKGKEKFMEINKKGLLAGAEYVKRS